LRFPLAAKLCYGGTGNGFISLRRANSIAVNYNDCHQVEEDRRGLPALVHDLMPQRHWQLRTF